MFQDIYKGTIAIANVRSTIFTFGHAYNLAARKQHKRKQLKFHNEKYLLIVPHVILFLTTNYYLLIAFSLLFTIAIQRTSNNVIFSDLLFVYLIDCCFCFQAFKPLLQYLITRVAYIEILSRITRDYF